MKIMERAVIFFNECPNISRVKRIKGSNYEFNGQVVPSVFFALDADVWALSEDDKAWLIEMGLSEKDLTRTLLRAGQYFEGEYNFDLSREEVLNEK